MLFLNATDLDGSREYGQDSIIYSLEGSSQFRISARSGEPRPVSASDGASSLSQGPRFWASQLRAPGFIPGALI